MKEQELKEQFRKWEQTQIAPPLEPDHATHFFTQLSKRKKRRQQRYFMQWAAAALVFIGLGGVFQLSQEQTTPEIIRFQKAETHLMRLIEEQMNSFEYNSSPATKEILERSKSKLKSIPNDYHTLYEQWEINPNQSQLIHALINNLNTQINLLTEINTTLKTIQNTNYEDFKI